MLCPVCQSNNPDTNLFCGQCGHPLATSHAPSNYPPEGFDEVEEPVTQQIDPRVPANEYTQPRVTRRSEPLNNEPRGPFSRAYDATEESPRNSEPSRKTETVASAPSTASSTSIFGLNNIERPKFETDPYSVKPIANSMFDFEPVAERSGQSIHGPSFLGLSDPDFLEDDEEKPSHARRNWLLVALAIVIVIAAVQWRNIRNTGIQYAGTLHFNFPSKKGQGQAQVAPEQAAPPASGQTASSEPGKPAMEVNPTINGAAPATTASGDQAKPAEENLLSVQPTASNAAPDSKNAKPAATNSANPESQAQETARAEERASAAAKESQQNASANSSAAKAAPAPAKNAEVAEARPPKAKAEAASRARRKAETPEAPKRAPGSDDVARAISASDPATAANWLWAATKKGNTEAPVLLADYYAQGRGVPKDCEQATVLLRSAATAGNPRASARLGMYYATGQCVRQDRAEAWRWLSAAHEKDPASDWIDQYRRRLWTQMSPEERARAGSGPTASE